MAHNKALTVGEQLKKFLRGEGISQENAAKMIGVSRPTLSEYMNRATFPEDSLQVVKKLWPAFSPDGVDSVEVQDEKKPATDAAGDPWKDKYLAVLEDAKRFTESTAEAAARAAFERLTQDYATKQEVKGVAINLDELEARAGKNHDTFLAFREAAILMFADIHNLEVRSVRGQLDTLMREFQKARKTHSQPAAGKHRKA